VDLLPHHDNLPVTGYNFNNIDLLLRLRRASSLLENVISQAIAATAAATAPAAVEKEKISPSLAAAAAAAAMGEEEEEGRLSLPPSLPPSLHLTMDADALRRIEDGQSPVPVLVVNTLGWTR